ncbi:MAG TPA: hypothetical protein VIL72_06685, partial [Beijerinckiaceae bacterium]
MSHALRIANDRASRAALEFAGLFVAYVVLEWVSDIRELRGLPVTAWNPGLGVLFAAMVRGRRTAPAALFIGSLITETLLMETVWRWEMAAIIAGIATAGYALLAAAARAL